MYASLEDLEALRGQIDQRLASLYPAGPDILKKPVDYIATGRGKRLRPLLTLLTARACGGNVEQAMPAAIAVEALHNFTLVHDDIMDRDETRHGQPSVHARWSESVAILTGDVLFVLALRELRQSTAHVDALTAAFTSGAIAVCEGQALDLDFEDRSDVSLGDYLDMIDLKTGYMLGLAAEMGAISAGANAEIVGGTRKFGRLVGRAFQIQDDLLEVYSDAGTMGKSLGSDLVAGKKTYLLIAATERDPQGVASILKAAREEPSAGLAMLRNLLQNTEVQTEAEKQIQQIIAEATEALAPIGEGQGELAAYAEMILIRKR